ncbi:hypothetical protein [Pedobacter xixiisoli]|uniref:hypothetical protein n=1 Tax=Pedobacter xixiisoli TaxID=1476464 RepID=UPI00110CB22B|nr:hypothetical protein [Pedobacter xixiisoli]
MKVENKKSRVMTTFSFEIEQSEVSKLKAVLKAFGVKKMKIKDDESELSKEEFEEKIEKAKSGSGTILKTKKDIDSFFDSL